MGLHWALARRRQPCYAASTSVPSFCQSPAPEGTCWEDTLLGQCFLARPPSNGAVAARCLPQLSKEARPEQKHLMAMQEAGLDHQLNTSGRREMKCEVQQSLSHVAVSWFEARLVVLEQVNFSV